LNESNYELPQNRERIFFVCFRKDLKIREFGFPRPLGKPCSIDQILEPSPKGVKVVCRPDTYFTKKDFKPDVDLSGQIMLPNRPIQIGYVNKGGQGERIYSTYGHAVTLSAYGGGVGSKTGLYLVDGVIRKLSPRECARVQGFPESFIIPNLSTQAYKQFGNSVAVNVVKAIAEQIVFSLQSSKLHSQAPKMASHQSGN
jgi:DNA (cytosine-5)-methyltransferase 1